jgi:hypothetical protein
LQDEVIEVAEVALEVSTAFQTSNGCLRIRCGSERCALLVDGVAPPQNPMVVDKLQVASAATVDVDAEVREVLEALQEVAAAAVEASPEVAQRAGRGSQSNHTDIPVSSSQEARRICWSQRI